MPDTPEEKARRKKLLDELWAIEAELDIQEQDLFFEQIDEAVKQTRKEMAEERKMSEGNDKINSTRKENNV